MTESLGRPQSNPVPQPVSSLAARLAAFADPDAPAFCAVLLLPALYQAACYLIGPAAARSVRLDQLSFFAGLAIYATVLKWIGWNVLTRHLPHETPAHRTALFPAEIFCGLALCCAWFYFRNLLGLLVPSAYEITELGALKYLAVVVHLAALDRRFPAGLNHAGWRPTLRSYLKERATPLLITLFFTLCLFLALRDVSWALHVQSTDPLCHGYFARMYLRNGIFNGGAPAIYTTGYGAINAVTAALVPVNMVQILSFQHVLLNFLAFFLIVASIGAILKRNVWALYGAIVPFLLLIPLYDLRPWDHYEGTPRQAAPALAAAICLLPVWVRAENAVSFYCINLIIVMLEGLCVALNPACAPFVAILAPLTLAILCFKTRAAKQSVMRTLAVHAGMLLLVGATILICDPYYQRVIAGKERPNVVGQQLAVQKPTFSASDAMKEVAKTSPLAFEISVEEAFRVFPRLVWLPTFAFALLALAWLVHLRSTKNSEQNALLIGAAGIAAVWLVMVYLIAAIRGALEPNASSWDLAVLRTYLGLMLFRMQTVIVFFVLAASAASLYLRLDGMSWRTKALILAPIALVCASVLPLNTMRRFRQSAFTVPNSTCLGPVSRDDLELVAWADEHLAHEPGVLGLACTDYCIGPEKHLYPYSGSQAVVLYAQRTNYCFFSCDPVPGRGYDEYVAHVENGFDARWCLDQGIRWFYIKDDVLPLSRALDNAVKSGALKPIKTIGQSSIYEVIAN